MNRQLLKYACVALAFAVQAPAVELKLPKDGWASWQVEAVEDAPAFCCWSNWGDRRANGEACDLDGGNHGYGNRNDERTDSIRVYARFSGGRLERLRTLAGACPVKSKTPIHQLDAVATDDSARWLTGLTQRGDVTDDALTSLALHRGDLAFNTLRDLARGGDRSETRKNAIFWLAQARGIAGADIVRNTMFSDPSADVRKHSAFAITVSKSPHIAADLTKLGNTDTDGDVRAQAWFWLAHTGDASAEQAITTALKKDHDGHVREQAVFALSQLPDERAPRALIAAAEDRSLDREQRKRAVFWLGQSDSPAAQSYLDNVLTRSP